MGCRNALGAPPRVSCGPPRVGLVPEARLRHPATGLPPMEAPSKDLPARPLPTGGRHSGLGRDAVGANPLAKGARTGCVLLKAS
eukprot:6191463-Alexandrium_andersonii.AAC.1